MMIGSISQYIAYMPNFKLKLRKEIYSFIACSTKTMKLVNNSIELKRKLYIHPKYNLRTG